MSCARPSAQYTTQSTKPASVSAIVAETNANGESPKKKVKHETNIKVSSEIGIIPSSTVHPIIRSSPTPVVFTTVAIPILTVIPSVTKLLVRISTIKHTLRTWCMWYNLLLKLLLISTRCTRGANLAKLCTWA